MGDRSRDGSPPGRRQCPIGPLRGRGKPGANDVATARWLGLTVSRGPPVHWPPVRSVDADRAVVHDPCNMSPAIQEMRRAQGEATRNHILETTAALLHDSSPAILSMPAVAEAAGVSVRTLYVHFPNKPALY